MIVCSPCACMYQEIMYLNIYLYVYFFIGRYRSDADYTSLINKEVRIFDNGTGCVDIEVRDDDIVEGLEQFSVTLSVPFGTRGIIIQPNTATVTILDDGDGMGIAYFIMIA